MPKPQLIRTLLTSALQLWLRSLVSQVERLEVAIDASDRQLFAGQVPAISLQAEKAIYRGIHLSHLSLQATHIRLNLGQVLRGKPIRLLAPVPAQLQAQVSATDLNQSLASDLLSPALAAATQRLLPNQTLQVQQIALSPGTIHLQGALARLAPSPTQPQAEPIQATACLSAQLVAQEAWLQAQQITLSAAGQTKALPDQTISLGDAALQQLDITADAIALTAQIKILP